jgi:hypothetical protein
MTGPDPLGKPEPPPAWIHELSTFEIADLLGEPDKELTDHQAKRLADKAQVDRVDSKPALDTGPSVWRLHPDEVEGIELLRERLDNWWAALSDDAHNALVNNRLGTVDRLYRPDISDFGPGAEVPDGHKIKLPDFIYGYVRLRRGSSRHRSVEARPQRDVGP